MALCFSTKSVATTSKDFDFDMKKPTLIINGNKYDFKRHKLERVFDIMSTHHTYLNDMHLESEALNMNKRIVKNEWIHAEVTFEHPKVEPLTEIGIHFYKHKNNMDDIQFTNPYEKIKLNDNEVVDDDDDDFLDDDALDDDDDDDDDDDYNDDDVLDDDEEHHSQ